MTTINHKRLQEIEEYMASQKRLDTSSESAPTLETKLPEPETLHVTPEQTSLKNDLFDYAKFRLYTPSEMLQEKRWVRYFLKAKPEGGTAKIPLGNHSDPETWSYFDDCVKQLEHEQGIGYC